MQSASKATAFDERALAHFLDFSRNRSKVKIIPSHDGRDAPTIEVRIPVENDGDQRGMDALMSVLPHGHFREIDIPAGSLLFPCLLREVSGFGEDEILLTLVPAGPPLPR
jgi:hypothetical protein